MTTFYIYEVPGEKNGATKDWKSRIRSNFRKYEVEPILIETMEGPDTEAMWQVVGDREWELADQNGYKRGDHYVAIRKKSSHNNRTTSHFIGQANPSPGNHKEGATKGGIEMAKVVNTCEHCGYQGRGPNFYRYHSKNCKKLEASNVI